MINYLNPLNPVIILKKIKRSLRLKINELKIKKYIGNKYLCPCCGFKSDSWKVAGENAIILIEKEVVGGGRYAHRCHRCNSSNRSRLIYTYLFEELKIQDHKTVTHILHVAPEKGIFDRLKKETFITYIAADINPVSYFYMKGIEHIDIQNMVYQNNSFDMIICNHVLEHVRDDKLALSEIYRVLKPGAFAILQVPISANTKFTDEDPSITLPDERIRRFGQSDHLRLYGQDYIDHLSDAGFKVDRINISDKYPQYGLNPKEDIFICIK